MSWPTLLTIICECVTLSQLTHWGRVTHICVGNLAIIGSDNGLSPGRRQAIIWTNAGILLIRTLGTNFSEILGKIHSFSFQKMHLKMSSAKGRLFSFGLNELNVSQCSILNHQTSGPKYDHTVSLWCHIWNRLRMSSPRHGYYIASGV